MNSKGFSHINSYISEHNLLPPNATVILGLSGGPDSVFLLHFLANKNIKLIAAHLDHEWRKDSEKDTKFCKEQAEKLGIPLVSKKISELDLQIKFNGSKEEVGRKARRYFLEQTMKEHTADAIALAHHLQDQQETFFIRLLRGASLSGLTAMKPKNGPYIRPLLNTSKNDILAYLDEHQIPYLTDPSNESQQFLRNRIRTGVIPALKAADGRFDHTFASTLGQLQETEAFLGELSQEYLGKLTICKKGFSGVNLKDLMKLPTPMRRRIILEWLCRQNVPFTPTQKFFAEMERFFRQPGSKEHQIHETWKLVKKKDIGFIQQNK